MFLYITFMLFHPVCEGLGEPSRPLWTSFIQTHKHRDKYVWKPLSSERLFPAFKSISCFLGFDFICCMFDLFASGQLYLSFHSGSHFASCLPPPRPFKKQLLFFFLSFSSPALVFSSTFRFRCVLSPSSDGCTQAAEVLASWWEGWWWRSDLRPSAGIHPSSRPPGSLRQCSLNLKITSISQKMDLFPLLSWQQN